MANVKVIEANKSSRRQRSLFMENQLRVAAYCRVSTDSEEQKTSYQSQILHFKQKGSAGVKFTEEFYEKISNKSGKIENLSTYAIDDKQLAYTYAPNNTYNMWDKM